MNVSLLKGHDLAYMKFDYSAFHSNPSLHERMNEVGGKILLGLFAVALLLAVPGVLMLIYSPNSFDGAAIFLAFALMFVGMAVAGYYRYGRIIQLKKFAEMNGLHYEDNAAFDDRSGVIFRQGHDRQFRDIIRGSDATAFAEIGNYQYTTGSGKNRHTHTFGYLRIKLPRKLPNMVLDARANNFLNRISNLPESFKRGEKLSLEGDFDQHFTLYAPKGYKRDALYVFTPDVMQVMIQKASRYDCEIIDDDLYVYSSKSFHLTDETEFQALVALAQDIAPEVRQESKHYADANVGDRAANRVAAPGARLKTGISVFSIFFIAVVIGYIAFILLQALWLH